MPSKAITASWISFVTSAVYIIAYGCCTSDEISILTFNISPPYFIVIYISKNFICAFDNISSNNELDNSLLSCSKYAIDVLSKSDENFFLIIEGGKIDWESHNNNIDNMINELLAFDDVVEYCLNYAKNQPDTCVLVTADHETGGLLLPKTGEIISDNLFTTSSHTGKLVEYYFYPEGINDMPYLIDNTYIYKLLYEIISNN